MSCCDRIYITNGEYSLILRKKCEFAVVRNINTETLEYDYTVNYWNFGYGMSKYRALALAMDCFVERTEKDYVSRSSMKMKLSGQEQISYERMAEIASAAIQNLDAIELDDFIEDASLEKDEAEWFSIELEDEDFSVD